MLFQDNPGDQQLNTTLWSCRPGAISTELLGSRSLLNIMTKCLRSCVLLYSNNRNVCDGTTLATANVCDFQKLLYSLTFSFAFLCH